MPDLRQRLEDLPVVLRVAWNQGLLAAPRPLGGLSLLRRLAVGRHDPFVAIHRWAWDRPDALAVSDDRRSVTWAALAREVEQTARGLALQGVTPGARVALVCANRVESVVIQAAVAQLGATLSLLSPHMTPADVAARSVGCRVLVGPATLLAGASAAGLEGPVLVVPAPEVAPAGALGQAALVAGGSRKAGLWPHARAEADVVMHTSGTSGRSKGARLDLHGWRLATPFQLLERLDLRAHERLATPCPLYHAGPQLFLGLALLAGSHLHLMQSFQPADVVGLGRAGVHRVLLVPTLLDRLLRLGVPPWPDLRGLLSTGAALRPALKTALAARFGPVVYDFYGATELGVVSVATPSDLATDPATVGRPLPGVRVRLLDDDGRDVPAGQPGELFVASDTAMVGYEGLAPSASGWSTVGDVARLDERGLLYLVDRKRDMVVSGGVNLFPTEIEEALERCPGVREAACAGVPDAEWGEALNAWVVPEGGGLDPEAVRVWARQHLARTWVPKAVHLVHAVPRSPTGKVLRRVLVESLRG